MPRTVHYAGAIAAGVLLLPPVFAEDRISGEVPFEVRIDTVTSADSEENEFTNTYTTIEPAFTVALTPRLALNAGLVLEEVDPKDGVTAEPGDDLFMENHGLDVSELFFEWSGDAVSLHVGKLGAAFGVAWDAAPGVYGVDFAEDYEIAEQWALGAAIPFGEDEEESLVLTVDAFMADTTVLDSCVFTECVRTRRADGGVANTSVPKSFSATLGAESLPALGGLGFQAGFLRRASGDDSGPEEQDETGFALALVHAVELDGDRGVEWVLEGVRLNDFEGGAADVTYFTAGLAYLDGPWNVAVAGTTRKTGGTDGGEDVDDTLFQVSAGYAFESGFSVDVGWKHEEVEDESTQTIGMLVAWGFEF